MRYLILCLLVLLTGCTMMSSEYFKSAINHIKRGDCRKALFCVRNARMFDGLTAQMDKKLSEIEWVCSEEGQDAARQKKQEAQRKRQAKLLEQEKMDQQNKNPSSINVKLLSSSLVCTGNQYDGGSVSISAKYAENNPKALVQFTIGAGVIKELFKIEIDDQFIILQQYGYEIAARSDGKHNKFMIIINRLNGLFAVSDGIPYSLFGGRFGDGYAKGKCVAGSQRIF